MISIGSDLENSFVKDLVKKSVPTVGRYEDFMIKKIIFLGIFHSRLQFHSRSEVGDGKNVGLQYDNFGTHSQLTSVWINFDTGG